MKKKLNIIDDDKTVHYLFDRDMIGITDGGQSDTYFGYDKTYFSDGSFY
ncbi:MAG: hypothetical protein QMB11_01715 [Nonlabens sp.]